MLRTQTVKLIRASPSLTRSFAATAFRAGAGDLGGVRSGGSASSDAFNRREQASENKFIREKELESLRKLKEKLAIQRKHLDELDKHIEELEASRKGEQ
ncbi:hypothetical protein DV735_g3557, partial [Chaetothyriales sp. CBS 134920]